MQFRKIIKFGEKSHVVSLPIAWVQKHKLSKGDTLQLESIGNSLMFSPLQEDKKEKIIETISVNATSTPATLKRQLISAYESNADTIIFTGNKTNQFSSTINQLLNEFIALEIIEHKEQRIICKTYVNCEEVNILKFIHRIDNSIISMVQDVKEYITAKKEDEKHLREDVISKSKTIDKIFRMLRRVIRKRLDQQKAKEKETPLELLRYWQAITLLEELADVVKFITINSKEHLSTPKTFLLLVKEGKEIYGKVMQAFYQHNTKKAFNNSANLHAFAKNITQRQQKEHNLLLEGAKQFHHILSQLNRLSY